jgi:hypothetical protein
VLLKGTAKFNGWFLMKDREKEITKKYGKNEAIMKCSAE